MIGSPDQIDALAAEVRAHAVEVRSVAADHVNVGQATHWVSAAGSVHLDQIWADHRAAHAVADDLDAAAGLLGAHADAVRDRMAAIAATLAAVAAAVAEGVEDVQDMAAAALEDIGDITDQVGEFAGDALDTTLDVATFGLLGDD